jgi:hypothetical protein
MKLEDIEKTMVETDKKILETNKEIKRLTEGAPFDPVLSFWLQSIFGFDYNTEKTILNDKETRLRIELESLATEKARLQAEFENETWLKKLKNADIKFAGMGLLSFDGSILRLKCPQCGSKIDYDATGTTQLNTILSVRSFEDLKVVLGYGSDIISVPCGRTKNGSLCGYTFGIKIIRGKV